MILYCNGTIKLTRRPPANPRNRFVNFRQYSSKHGSMNNSGLFYCKASPSRAESAAPHQLSAFPHGLSWIPNTTQPSLNLPLPILFGEFKLCFCSPLGFTSTISEPLPVLHQEADVVETSSFRHMRNNTVVSMAVICIAHCLRTIILHLNLVCWQSRRQLLGLASYWPVLVETQWTGAPRLGVCRGAGIMFWEKTWALVFSSSDGDLRDYICAPVEAVLPVRVVFPWDHFEPRRGSTTREVTCCRL